MKSKNGKARTVGGFEGDNGPIYDNTNKKQNHKPPMGHGEVMSKASSYSTKNAKPSGEGMPVQNEGSSAALSSARRSGSSPGPMGNDKDLYERKGSGVGATSRAMNGHAGGGVPAIGEKASGYREVSEAKPANKAKRQK